MWPNACAAASAAAAAAPAAAASVRWSVCPSAPDMCFLFISQAGLDLFKGCFVYAAICIFCFSFSCRYVAPTVTSGACAV